MSRVILNVGIPRTATNYVDRALMCSPHIGHGHYAFIGGRCFNYVTGEYIRVDPRETFVIGFVRNPFDLMVSHYEILWNGAFKEHPHTERVRSMSFEEYVRSLWHRGLPRETGLFPKPEHRSLFHQLYDLSPGHMGSLSGLMVDYLGRYETLHDDLAALADAGIMRVVEQRDLKVNAADYRRPYQEYFENVGFRQEFERRYLDDLVEYGYSFDGMIEAGVTYGFQHRRSGF